MALPGGDREAGWTLRLERLRRQLAVLASEVADTEDKIAVTFSEVARTSPDRAERLTAMAASARDYAEAERARAHEYGL